MKVFDYFKTFIGSNGEENLEKLSFDDLLKKASSIDSDNQDMKKKLNNLNEENTLLKNSIINNNNQNSEFSKFLKLMEINLLNLQDNNAYSINDFKKFLYDKNLFYGTLEEDDIHYLNKRELKWDNEKENYLLGQEILQKNLKILYSNMFIPRDNKKQINENKQEEKNIQQKKKEKENNGEKKNNNNINKEIFKKYNNDLNFTKKDKEEEVNIFADFLLEENNNEN